MWQFPAVAYVSYPKPYANVSEAISAAIDDVYTKQRVLLDCPVGRACGYQYLMQNLVASLSSFVGNVKYKVSHTRLHPNPLRVLATFRSDLYSFIL